MSRIELGGFGDPIPNIALPDPNLSGDLPPLVLMLEDGSSFRKVDYEALGYNRYEVWCVGGAGGRGSAVAGWQGQRLKYSLVRMPDSVWEQQLAYWRQEDARQNYPRYSGMSPLGTPMPPEGVYYWSPGGGGIQWILSSVGVRYVQNPEHLADHITYYEYVQDESEVQGGGGGGGGLHRVNGMLEDLPDAVPVVVGKAGADAPAGQTTSPNPIPMWSSNTWDRTYAVVPTYADPQSSGEDGGTSSFGNICVASGGKGGSPAVVTVGGQKYFRANGGDGGLGGRSAAGGGAKGSSTAANGQDGTWDGTVGSGGGGGRGGHPAITSPPILPGT